MSTNTDDIENLPYVGNCWEFYLTCNGKKKINLELNSCTQALKHFTSKLVSTRKLTRAFISIPVLMISRSGEVPLYSLLFWA